MIGIEHYPFLPLGPWLILAALVVGLCVGYDQGRKDRKKPD